MKRQKLGLRNIKTAISVMACVVIDMLFEMLFAALPSSGTVLYRVLSIYISRNMSVYACIAAVITMCSTLPLSRRSGAERILGTLLGGAAGALMVIAAERFLLPQIITLPLGVMVLIYLLTLLGRGEMVTVTLTVFLITMISGPSQPHIYVASKVFATSLGAAVSLFVNRIIKPKGEYEHEKEN